MEVKQIKRVGSINSVLKLLKLISLRVVALVVLIICALLTYALRDNKLSGAPGAGGMNVRVALATGAGRGTISVTRGSYFLKDADTNYGLDTLAQGRGVNVSLSPDQRISLDGSLAPGAGQRLIFEPSSPEEGLIAYNSRSYRGSLIVEVKNGAMNIINSLDVDMYLLGVLPLEMGMSDAPAEALKAQAVVSRTYALNKKTESASYDLVTGASNQMYGGYSSEKAHTSAAVQATAGQVILYDGQLIDAFFSSNSGGYTEDAENAWNESLPYAKAIASPTDAYALQASQDASGYPASTYQWQIRYTLDEIRSKISEWNTNNPDNRVNIGNFQSMSAYARAYDPLTRKITDRANTSGRVTRLDLSGSSGTQSLYRQNIRSFLNLPSAMFSIEPEGGVSVYNGAGVTVMMNKSVRESFGVVAYGQASEINKGSDNFYILTADGMVEMKKDAAAELKAYVINGKGYGHGVGMSQWGAIGMAVNGAGYERIIEYYYNQNKNDGRLIIKNIRGI